MVIDCESRLRLAGVDLVLVQQSIAAGADLPDFTEVQADCAQLGLHRAAAHMGEVVRILADHPVPGPAEHDALARLGTSWLTEVGSPAARTARLAFIRLHLPDMVTP